MASAPVDAPGELLHCVPFRGMTVKEVRAVLAERSASIKEFILGDQLKRAQQVPDNWFVAGVLSPAPGEVLVVAQQDRVTFTPMATAHLRR